MRTEGLGSANCVNGDNMFLRLVFICLVLAATLGAALQAHAVLEGVSGKPVPATLPFANLTTVRAGGAPGDVAISLANGFPIWYRDAGGTKLELCLDNRPAVVGAKTVLPCLTSEPFITSPISFPNNFGTEAQYWSASAFTTFTSTLNGQPAGGGSVLLETALEAGFLNLVPADGQQSVFARIRLRIDIPVTGTYRVTHPFGTRDYVVGALDLEREINQTQDIGLLSPLDFARALANGPDPGGAVLPEGFPAVNSGIVSSAATTIGPFLKPTAPFATGDLTGGPAAVNGSLYLALPAELPAPAAPELPIVQAVTPGPFGAAFTVQLLDPPAGFFLNGADSSQTIQITAFEVSGKLFNDGPNTPPTANSDTAGTAINTPVAIDVVANDVDTVTAENVHGINPQAMALYSGTEVLRPLDSVTTANGATVRRFTNIATGRSTFTYTPAPGFAGVDTFQYVVQDHGGLISAPAPVTVTVENQGITRAEYRPKIGRWRIEGLSSDTDNNMIALFAEPRAFLSGSETVPPVTVAAVGTVSLKATAGAIDYLLNIEPMPTTPITRIHIHVAGGGDPIIFTLFNSLDGAFTNPLTGTLSVFDLQPRPANGINTFADAVAAIRAGNAYVDVHTSGNPGGELRGAVVSPQIGTAEVKPDGTWIFKGKSKASPAALQNINAVSSNGNVIFGFPLTVR